MKKNELPLPAAKTQTHTTGSAYKDSLPSWPPDRDCPVVVDNQGSVISRYGDDSWDLTIWHGKRLPINFGDGKTRGARISPENAAVLRMISFYWLFGPHPVGTATTLEGRHTRLKRLFEICSVNAVSVTNLSRYPRLIAEYGRDLAGANGNSVLFTLHTLWEEREHLGFVILDAAALEILQAALPRRCSVQTPYIPPRIWSYQVNRLAEVIEDYLALQDRVANCYRFCLDAYENNAKAIGKSREKRLPQTALPFDPRNEFVSVKDGRKFYGEFMRTAARFGIDDLLNKWANTSRQNGIKTLGSYLSLVSNAGLAYVLNFSLMRVEEGASLLDGCHFVETDELGEEIHLVAGATSKTVSDTNANWIVSPSAERAIRAMGGVATLRSEGAANDNPKEFKVNEANPKILQVWGQEPWRDGHKQKSHGRRIRAYGELVKAYPKLFDPAAICITKQDLDTAILFTPDLDPTVFNIGKAWPFAWHQLRRTGAVNMLGSGLVSEQSLQYQLKHSSRAMSRYYGQGYFRLSSALSDEARGFYIREMYDAVAREFRKASTSEMISPHGPRRLDQIITPITSKDHEQLIAEAKLGRLSYRGTLLGGCAKLGAPCPYGGISNVSQCMGFGQQKACDSALIDPAKRPLIEGLIRKFRERLADAEPNSMLYSSLEIQIESATKAIRLLDNHETDSKSR